MEQTTTEAIVESKGGKRLKSGGKAPLIIVGAVLAVLLAAYIGLCAYAAGRDTFQPNRRINGIDVGGLTVDQAQETLETSLLSQEITLTDPDTGTQAVITVADLGYTADEFAGDARFWMDTDRQMGFFRKGWAYIAYATGRWSGGANWPDMDRAALRETVTRLSGDLSREPLDGSWELAENAVVFTKARDGRTLDAAALETALADVAAYSETGYQVPFSFTAVPARVLTAREVHEEIAGEMKNAGYDAATDSITPEQLGAEFDVDAAQAALDAAEPGSTVRVDAVIEHPRVTAKDLKGVLFRDVLGTATTHVSGTAARISNVKLSASTINGTVLNCGDVFSYNETVGQRTAARGYQAAPAYVKGETVDEIGGGICQTSSTLYLACLRSNLAITERYAHRYTPAYIDWGLDATVSWGGPDYKFTNDTDYPVKIVTSYSNGYLTVKVLGTNAEGTSVKMTTEVLSKTAWETVYEEDDTLPAGTEQVKVTPYGGAKVKSYRSVYDKDGKLLSTSFEASSDYKVRNKVIVKGPAVQVPASGTTVPESPTSPTAPAETTPTEPAAPPVQEPETPVAEPEVPMEESPSIIVIAPEEPAA
ncbi:VanW family protein [Dysosmobacter sp. Sow4_B12]|uniref:VanW family protein n=1 Tax=Dysosmobacter sp. Sow4_B12 TaxID=3438777 RepID=UPI003F90233A